MNIAPYIYGQSKGGAPSALAPEIMSVQPRTSASLNYDKADIWALGQIISSIINHPTHPSVGLSLALRTFIGRFSLPSRYERLSCYDTHAQSQQLSMPNVARSSASGSDARVPSPNDLNGINDHVSLYIIHVQV